MIYNLNDLGQEIRDLPIDRHEKLKLKIQLAIAERLERLIGDENISHIGE
jgi:hypothetical protein